MHQCAEQVRGQIRATPDYRPGGVEYVPSLVEFVEAADGLNLRPGALLGMVQGDPGDVERIHSTTVSGSGLLVVLGRVLTLGDVASVFYLSPSRLI
jgi:hypothetical protein